MNQEIAKIEKSEIAQSLDYAFVVVCSTVGVSRYTGVKPPKLKFACQTLQEASDICGSYINEYVVGDSNWVGGTVYHPKLGKFAHVSYNGRVWKYNSKMSISEYNEFPKDDLLKTWEEFMPENAKKLSYDFKQLKGELLKLSL